ncbi:MAG: hypothetical protein PHG76_05135 [Eubacteriales bacterium]|nr:hypothetical protein [Eubacteriales bacterium]
MQTAEVDTSELYTGYCLGICFWPPQAGHMCAGLKGQDIVGPTLALLHQKGLNTSSGSSLSAFPYENMLFLSAFPTFSRTPKRFKSNATLVVWCI